MIDNMSVGIIEKLDFHIDALLQSHERHKLENKLLREKQSQLILEREELLKKHTLATEGIKKLIDKLKILEQAYDNSGTS